MNHKCVYIIMVSIWFMLGCSRIGNAPSTNKGGPPFDANQGYKNDIVLLRSHNLQLNDGWQVAEGVEGPNVGMPLEAYVKLYAVRGDKFFRIKAPEDFGPLGALCITNKEGAIQFLELFTGPYTFFMFQRPYAITIVTNTSTIHFGSLPDSLYKRLGITPVIIQEFPEGFIVTRYLLSCKELNQEHSIMKVQERLSKDGRYKIIFSSDIGKIDKWRARIPIFE